MARRSSTKQQDDNFAVGPHALRMSPDELRDAVSNFYGTKTLLFDKAFAEALLEYNTANRRISRRKLARLIDQMRVGQFENTGEPIIVSDAGVLNDGQHRLLAVIEADATVEMDLRFGIPRRAFTKTDTGSSRTGGDVLAIRGVTGGAAVAPALRLLILFRRGLPDSIREFVSNAEVDEAFAEWRDIEAVGRQLAALSFPRGVRSTPLLTTAFMASRSPGKDRLPEWLETLATGLASGRTDPGHVLRERLVRGVDAPVGTREGMIERFALMITSWNAFSAGAELKPKDFKWSATGKQAKPFPQIDGVRL